MRNMLLKPILRTVLTFSASYIAAKTVGYIFDKATGSR